MSFKTNISFSIIGLALILFNVSTNYIVNYHNSFNKENIELVEQFVKNDISANLFIIDSVDEEIDDKIDSVFNDIIFSSFVNFCNRKSVNQNIKSLNYSTLPEKFICYSIQPSSFDDYESL